MKMEHLSESEDQKMSKLCIFLDSHKIPEPWICQVADHSVLLEILADLKIEAKT